MSGLPKRKIVVPIDFSDDSFAALDTALQIAESPSEIHVIHVLADISVADPGVVWQTINDENRSQHATAAMREKLHDSKYRDVKVEIAFGDPGHQVVDFAEKLGAELIVMPSHGRSGVKRLLIGSVAERVVRLAHCPVLVMRDGVKE